MNDISHWRLATIHTELTASQNILDWHKEYMDDVAIKAIQLYIDTLLSEAAEISLLDALDTDTTS